VSTARPKLISNSFCESTIIDRVVPVVVVVDDEPVEEVVEMPLSRVDVDDVRCCVVFNERLRVNSDEDCSEDVGRARWRNVRARTRFRILRDENMEEP